MVMAEELFSPSRFFFWHFIRVDLKFHILSLVGTGKSHVIYALSVKDWSMVIVIIGEFAQLDDCFGIQVFTWIWASSSSALSDSWSDDKASSLIRKTCDLLELLQRYILGLHYPSRSSI